MSKGPVCQWSLLRRNMGGGGGVNQHTAIQAAPALAEPLQTVDGRQAGLGVIEGEELPGHGAPGARCGAFGARSDRRARVATSANGSAVP